ncbi:hypothetical protein DLAC_09494 [Tieghemostelium lacteum]|uniref:Uncharacterized protein n=1 Tax=Tieghemostelium lacteum TaxID=361077 RepID=A0A151Z6F9_TIELA|nr:hypothetical protein DLAC_09494 [Tieghemostelium lacteum]|eukprot:KYQ89546.1 hypothetical protein DLAC_09494 [Tieghemostelium lacteum]
MTIPHFLIKEILNYLFFASDCNNDELLNDIIINFLTKLVQVRKCWTMFILPHLNYPVFIINTKRSQRYYVKWLQRGIRLSKIRYMCNTYSQHLQELSYQVTELNSVYNLKYFLQDDRSLNDIILKSQFYNITKLELIVMDGDNGMNELKPIYTSNQIDQCLIKDLVITNIGFSSQNLNEFENILQDLNFVEKLTLNLESLDEYMCRVIMAKKSLTHLLLYRLNIDINSLSQMLESLPDLEQLEFNNVHIYGNKYIDQILPILNEKRNLSNLKLRLSTHDDFLGDCNRIQYSNLVKFLNQNQSIQRLLIKIQCIDRTLDSDQNQQNLSPFHHHQEIINNKNIKSLSFIVASNNQPNQYQAQQQDNSIQQYLKQQQLSEIIFQYACLPLLESLCIISPLDRKLSSLIDLSKIKDITIGGYVGPNIVQESYLPLLLNNPKTLSRMELRGNQSVKSSQWDQFFEHLHLNNHLKILNLIDVGLSNQALIGFLQSNHPSVVHLSIQTLHSNITPKDCTLALCQNSTLTSLQISRLLSNKFLDDNLECLCRVLKENKTLLHLDFTRNLLPNNMYPQFPTTSQILSVSNAITENKTLLSLSLDLYHQYSDMNPIIKDAYRESMILPIYSPPSSCK